MILLIGAALIGVGVVGAIVMILLSVAGALDSLRLAYAFYGVAIFGFLCLTAMMIRREMRRSR